MKIQQKQRHQIFKFIQKVKFKENVMLNMYKEHIFSIYSGKTQIEAIT